MLWSVALLLLVSAAAGLFVCPKDYCNQVRCSEELTAANCAAKNGRFEAKGGFCGCCPNCVIQIGEGQACSPVILLGSPRTSECGQGLSCDFNGRVCTRKVATRSSGACTARRNELMSGPQLLGRTLPICDADGTYAAKQCTGSRCYCVEKDGTTIDETSVPIQDSQDMLCTCARDRAAYQKLGIIGKMFLCTANGNYDRIQCTGSVCYCADPRTGKQLSGSQGVNIGSMSMLNC